MVLSSTLACALAGAHQSLTASQAALELRQANDLTSYLLETAPTLPGTSSGVSGDLTWRRTVSDADTTIGAAAICVRAVEVRGVRSGRRYAAQTGIVCPREIEP